MKISIHSDSTTSEINTVATDILNEFERRDFSTDLYLTGEIDKLTASNELMTNVMKEKKLQSLLGPKDQIRDDALSVIFDEVYAKKGWKDPQIRGAAQLIDKQLEKYGRETKNLAYADESSNINALLKDFKEPEVPEAIAKLPGMDTLIADLKDAQDDFEKTYLEAKDLQIVNKKTLSATKLGKLIRKHINDTIVIYLQGIVLKQPDIYEECFEVIKEIIEDNNRKVRRRLGDSDDDSSGDSTDQ